MPVGRHAPARVLHPDLAAAICARIADGRSLRSVCTDEDMPGRETVRRWLCDHEAFRTQYAAATNERVDAMAEDMLAIADDVSLDPLDRKVRIATRQWLMAKVAPKKYGDRVEHTGPDGGPILTEDITPLERARLIAFALEKAVRQSLAGQPGAGQRDVD